MIRIHGILMAGFGILGIIGNFPLQNATILDDRVSFRVLPGVKTVMSGR